MTAFAQTDLINNYIDRARLRDSKRLRDAIEGGGDVAARSVNSLQREADFVITGTTDSNTAAASSPVIILNDYGVTFPANHERTIMVETNAWNGSNRYRFTTATRILGSATAPTVKGTEQWLTDCRALVVGTLASGAVTEVTAECRSPGWWDGGTPLAGDFSSGDSVIQWLGANSPVRALTPLPGIVAPTSADVTDAIVTLHTVTSLTNGTSTLTTGTYEGTEAEENPADGRVVAEAILLPPVHAPVLIDTSATPDDVFIGALGISSDVVTWEIRVFVGELLRSTLV